MWPLIDKVPIGKDRVRLGEISILLRISFVCILIFVVVVVICTKYETDKENNNQKSVGTCSFQMKMEKSSVSSLFFFFGFLLD